MSNSGLGVRLRRSRAYQKLAAFRRKTAQWRPLELATAALSCKRGRKLLGAVPIAFLILSSWHYLGCFLADQNGTRRTITPEEESLPYSSEPVSADSGVGIVFVNRGVKSPEAAVIVAPEDVVRFAISNAAGCRWTVFVNGREDSKLEWTDNGLNITPGSHVWKPGHYHLRLLCRRSGRVLLDREEEFWVEWDIDFGKAGATYAQFLNPLLPQYARGQVSIDSTMGQLVLDPKSPDPNNPSYVMSQAVTDGLDNYRIFLYYRIIAERTGGFQIVLPGKLCLQVGDGARCPNDCTIKIGGSYVVYSASKGFIPNPTAKKRQAWHHTFTPVEQPGGEIPLCVAYRNSRLEVSSGVDAMTPVFSATIPQMLLQGTNRDITVRSYGSKIGFTRIIVRPFDWAGSPAQN